MEIMKFLKESLTGDEKSFELLDDLFFSNQKNKESQNLSDKFTRKYKIKLPSKGNNLRFLDRTQMSWDDYRNSQPCVSDWFSSTSSLASSMKLVNETFGNQYKLNYFKGDGVHGYYASLFNVVRDLQEFKKFKDKLYKFSFDGKNVERFGDFLIFTVSKLNIPESQSPNNQYIVGIFRCEEKYEYLKQISKFFNDDIEKLQKEEKYEFYMTIDFKCWRAISSKFSHCVMCHHNRDEFFVKTNSENETNVEKEEQEWELHAFQCELGPDDLFPAIPMERRVPCSMHCTQRVSEDFLTKICKRFDNLEQRKWVEKFFAGKSLSVKFRRPTDPFFKTEEYNCERESDKFKIGMIMYTDCLGIWQFENPKDKEKEIANLFDETADHEIPIIDVKNKENEQEIQKEKEKKEEKENIADVFAYTNLIEEFIVKFFVNHKFLKKNERINTIKIWKKLAKTLRQAIEYLHITDLKKRDEAINFFKVDFKEYVKEYLRNNRSCPDYYHTLADHPEQFFATKLLPIQLQNQGVEHNLKIFGKVLREHSTSKNFTSCKYVFQRNIRMMVMSSSDEEIAAKFPTLSDLFQIPTTNISNLVENKKKEKRKKKNVTFFKKKQTHKKRKEKATKPQNHFIPKKEEKVEEDQTQIPLEMMEIEPEPATASTDSVTQSSEHGQQTKTIQNPTIVAKKPRKKKNTTKNKQEQANSSAAGVPSHQKTDSVPEEGVKNLISQDFIFKNREKEIRLPSNPEIEKTFAKLHENAQKPPFYSNLIPANISKSKSYVSQIKKWTLSKVNEEKPQFLRADMLKIDQNFSVLYYMLEKGVVVCFHFNPCSVEPPLIGFNVKELKVGKVQDSVSSAFACLSSMQKTFEFFNSSCLTKISDVLNNWEKQQTQINDSDIDEIIKKIPPSKVSSRKRKSDVESQKDNEIDQPGDDGSSSKKKRKKE